jgi:hypothetical protein
LRSRRPLWPNRSACAGFAGLAQRSGLSSRPGLALRSRLAALTIRPPLTRMTLRSRPSRLALPPARPLRSLPSLIVCHATTPSRGSKLLSGV